jgi:hypothetical protein
MIPKMRPVKRQFTYRKIIGIAVLPIAFKNIKWLLWAVRIYADEPRIKLFDIVPVRDYLIEKSPTDWKSHDETGAPGLSSALCVIGGRIQIDNDFG